jgi:lincosamide nucleotidyltransferase A/C/D/E
MPRQASVDQVIEFLSITQALRLWIDGGWGVDALLRRQSRAHSDLDIIIDGRDLEKLIAILLSQGYVRERGDGVIFVAASGLAVDVHEVRFDERGYGIFDLPDGRQWPFPPSAFAGQGSIGGVEVQCLSPEAQVQCHAQGYEPTAKDIGDMQALQEHFGVILPLQFCRVQ